SPEMRESRAMTAFVRRPSARRASAKRPWPRTTAVAWARFSARSAVRVPLASPRTPSVPNRAIRARSALRALRRLAGLLEAGLLAGGAVGLAVDLVERTGEREAQRAGLTRGSAAADARDHVVRAGEAEQRERVGDELLVQLVGEVLLERAAVHREGARTGDQAHARDGALATTHGSAGDADDGARGLGVGLDRGRGLSGVVLNVFSHELVLTAAALTG